MSSDEGFEQPASGSEPFARLREAIRRTWGFESLRPLQAEAMRAALARRDAIVVLPTGGGKSLCYQAPALVGVGVTVVISPLIALMKDQVDGLVQNGVAAAMLSSAQSERERWEVRRRLAAGELKLVFCAPERAVLDFFQAELFEAGLERIAIDEAHCISEWGHDFRPEYRQLGELRRRAPDVPIQAYTATAAPRVRDDIARELGLVDPVVLVGSCDRPNLTYRFLPRRDVVAQTLEVVRRHPGDAGIVYCMRRKDVERVAQGLQQAGVRCVPYHAGLPSETRRQNQERFQSEEVQVVVATIAFGMGVDRSDVRFVVHTALPKGLEQYSQESGRAGRDSLPAECVLFHSGADYHGWKSLMERSAAEAGGGNADLTEKLRRLGEMMSFVNGAVCRHKVLVEHFGERWGRPPDGSGPPSGDGASCGACDVCLGELAAVPDATVVAQKILSCVVRCEQRFGAAHVTEVLRGSQTASVLRAGHDRVSTYGLLREHPTRTVRHWIDQLVGLDLLQTQAGRYPALFLTRAGVAVLKGEREVTLFALPDRAPERRRSRPVWSDVAAEEGAPTPDPRLFDELRALRRTLAAERGVPPYLIFSDRTLALMAAHQPRTPTAFRALKGVGDKKASELGPLFLAAVASFVERHAAARTGAED